jgi:hypothetical protein
MVTRWNDVGFHGVRQRTEGAIETHVRDVWESFRDGNYVRGWWTACGFEWRSV